MLVGGVLEFILGNTFPSVVFTTFGAFWLAYGGEDVLPSEATTANEYQARSNHSLMQLKHMLPEM